MNRVLIIAIIVSGVALVGGLFLFAKDQRSIGGATAREQQEKANAQFRVKAAKGIVNVDLCIDADGVYDFRKGTCKLP